ncbi:MAG: tRNA 2-selenouridine(34) synthase MnmH [Bacteroidales bacterium]|nr:tRNA 2-selenouridine(34) synthase MnmH [Bacteroidales bacterium]MCF8389644.1 tRNA 2-selenouridine(34) synthase MnmH [Bacteroidales bacterium]
MADTVSIEAFLEGARSTPVIDVRSPAEYEQAHIPHSVNIPLLDNTERKLVGTLYKKTGREEAIRTGFEIIAGKTSRLIEAGIKASGEGRLLVYCWRGGMRSASMAWLFERNGIQCTLLSGGYKNYRHAIKKYFSSGLNIKILGGMTGSGKTEILLKLKERGLQVVDLEGIAHHKGSAFGSLGESQQPTTEYFENLLYEAFSGLDKNKPIWLEDESKNIGRVYIPDELYSLMRKSPLYIVTVPKEKRIERLVADYGVFGEELLIESIEKISKKIGGQNANRAVEAIKEKNYHLAADISLVYYDKAYRFGLEKRADIQKYEIHCESQDAGINAEMILDLMAKA